MDPIVVIGAGPAGLAAGLELARGGRPVLVLDQGDAPGGISRTVRHKDIYFDLGGHRFFTRFPQVQRLWEETLPPESFPSVRRLSRIHYRHRFFNYPIKPLNAFLNLGLRDTLTALISYMGAKVHPIEPELDFEAWVSNNFGRFLFNVFFKTYTEKVWGISCREISSEWAAQRIQRLSLFTALLNAFLPRLHKGRIKTLIDEFRYPSLGPGMMYQALAEKIRLAGGEVRLGARAAGLRLEGRQVRAVRLAGVEEIPCSGLVSTAPLTGLVGMLDGQAPPEVRDAAAQLRFRSFL
ncbi:MAG: FAD-dependent oxidoreductase, partial [Elusimicrobia bacterium]|nr:FAD-dependent oxidoreductase [Elusimicrobiota bacterium]